MDLLIIFLAKYLIVFIIVLAIYAWFLSGSKIRAKFIVAFILAGIGALILTKLAGSVYFHQRPFAVLHIEPLVSHEADNGFPSEHTVLAVTLASLIYFYRKQLALIAFIASLLVGYGRVLADVHSAIDILAGTLIGLLAGATGYYFSEMLSAKRLKDHR